MSQGYLLRPLQRDICSNMKLVGVIWATGGWPSLPVTQVLVSGPSLANAYTEVCTISLSLDSLPAASPWPPGSQQLSLPALSQELATFHFNDPLDKANEAALWAFPLHLEMN
jgi:hypothetical protein